jgi:type II secretory pathway pseudopilin PulG
LAPAGKGSSGTIVAVIGIVVLVAVGCVGVMLVGIMLPALGKARQSARQIKDSTQIRGVQQSLILWAQNNSDNYPMPSVLDAADATVKAADGKDLPRHMMSILVFNGFISAELLVSPAEANGQIAAYGNYQYSMPAGAVNPRDALWDPAFKAYSTEAVNYAGSGAGTPGGLSYAVQVPLGARRARWMNTFSATEPIVGNRGPAWDSVGGRWVLHATQGPPVSGNSEVGTGSHTLLIHGGRGTWEGNIGYNDASVMFETMPDPPQLLMRFAGSGVGGVTFTDNIFVDENDATGTKDGTTGLAGNQLKNSNALLRGWNGGRFGEKGELIDIPSQLWFD